MLARKAVSLVGCGDQAEEYRARDLLHVHAGDIFSISKLESSIEAPNSLRWFLANGIRASSGLYSTRRPVWEPCSDPFGGILEPSGGIPEASGMAFICSVAAPAALFFLDLAIMHPWTGK